MSRVLAIIPARGGSKEIPRKNLIPLVDKPLIAWTILCAVKAGVFSDVIVSTDDEEIADVARSFGAEVPFLRPKEFAQDNSSTESAMIHALEWLQNSGRFYDGICLLQATSPIRRVSVLRDAFENWDFEQHDSLVSVTPASHFVWEQDDEEVKPTYDLFGRLRRQDLSAPLFYENGSYYATKTDSFVASQNRMSGKCKGVVLNQFESLEIDTHEDLFHTRVLLEALGSNYVFD